MFETLMSFLGYVFCFWMVWKIFDWMFHRTPIAKILWGQATKEQPINPECASCVRLEFNLKAMEASLATALTYKEKVVKLEKELAFWKQFAPTLVDFINRATMDQLDDIPNIGKTKAKKVIENRPYQTFNDIYKIGLSVSDVKAIRNHHENKYIYRS